MKLIGGARIGWMNASWPFAELTASRERLVIAGLLGRYVFTPQQVVSIEPFTMDYLMLGWGIRIKHSVASYPNKIVFWYPGSQTALLAKIAAAGFIPSANALSVLTDRGIPTRWETLLITFVLWNLLFVMNKNLARGAHPKLGICAFLAVFLLFVGSLAIWRVRWLQCLVLKPGRSLHEIKAWLIPIAIFMGFMSAAMAAAMFAGSF